MNWRSTLSTTPQGDVAVVPNSVMAKLRLVNHSLPAPVRRTAIEVRLDPRVMPERCGVALDAALKACRLPLESPAPAVVQTALRGDGAVYEIAFSVSGDEVMGPARTEVLARVQRHLFYSAIPLAVEGLAGVPRLEHPTPAELLAASDLFGTMAERERDLLAALTADLWLAPGETLFEQGDPAAALYVVASGTVGIMRREPDGSEFDRRMSPGGCPDAIGLITGSPYAATATALTPLKAYRLDGTAITAAIEEHPGPAAALEDLARRGQVAISSDAGADHDHRDERPDVFLSRMRGFLRRLAADVAREAPR